MTELEEANRRLRRLYVTLKEIRDDGTWVSGNWVPSEDALHRSYVEIDKYEQEVLNK